MCYPAGAVRLLPLNVFVFVAAATIATGSAARAASASSKADALVNQAVELRRNGDDQGALALLLQAYGLGHAPRATGQLGLCEQALGRWADAEMYITEALKAESDPWVKKNRRTLEDALVIVKSHIARVEIQGEPPGAEIWVNGTLAGKLPLAAPVRVSAGEVEVELRAPGFVREAKTMQARRGPVPAHRLARQQGGRGARRPAARWRRPRRAPRRRPSSSTLESREAATTGAARACRRDGLVRVASPSSGWPSASAPRASASASTARSRTRAA